MTDASFWGIHAKGGKLESILLQRGQLAIGWAALEDLTPIAHDRELLKAKLAAALPGEKPGAIPVYAGQLYRFVNELKVGDTVAYRSTADGLIHLGEVSGPYVHDAAEDAAHPNRRSVKWLKTVPITSVSQGALYELGSAMTFFQLKNYAEEWAQLLAGVSTTAAAESDETVASVVAMPIDASGSSKGLCCRRREGLQSSSREETRDLRRSRVTLSVTLNRPSAGDSEHESGWRSGGC